MTMFYSFYIFLCDVNSGKIFPINKHLFSAFLCMSSYYAPHHHSPKSMITLCLCFRFFHIHALSPAISCSECCSQVPSLEPAHLQPRLPVQCRSLLESLQRVLYSCVTSSCGQCHLSCSLLALLVTHHLSSALLACGVQLEDPAPTLAPTLALHPLLF